MNGMYSKHVHAFVWMGKVGNQRNWL